MRPPRSARALPPGGAASGPAKPVPRRPLGAFGFAGLWRRLAGLFGSLLAMGGAKAIELPENRAEGLYHLYKEIGRASCRERVYVLV